MYTAFTSVLSLLLVFSWDLSASGKNISPDSAAYQEKVTVRGIVKDGRGDPLQGADLYGELSVNHTVSGRDGAFFMEVAPGDLKDSDPQLYASLVSLLGKEDSAGSRLWWDTGRNLWSLLIR